MFKLTNADAEELQAICKGKISWTKCPDCDTNGWQYWDGEIGEGVCNNPSYINPERVDRDGCETCGGIAYLFKWND